MLQIRSLALVTYKLPFRIDSDLSHSFILPQSFQHALIPNEIFAIIFIFHHIHFPFALYPDCVHFYVVAAFSSFFD